MVYVNLKGGLGNQMFQYAAAKALAERLGTKVRVDLRELLDRTEKENFTFRDYELDNFNLSCKTISEGFFNKKLNKSPLIDNLPVGKQVRTLIKDLLQIPQLYIEKQFNYNPEFENLQGNIYLDGYWQSERYFKSIRNKLLADFSFRNEPSVENTSVIALINRSNAVSVHVRRGDFVQNEQNLSYHGVCDINYYYNAIKKISNEEREPVFFFFSDDIDWVKKNINIENHPVNYINHNKSENAYEDMRLMSLCKHNIIANSSFSWWGAWLNQNPDKIVIVPLYWFKNESVNVIDLIPTEWVKMY